MIEYIGIFSVFIAFFVPGVMGIIYFGKELRKENDRAKKSKELGNQSSIDRINA